MISQQQINQLKLGNTLEGELDSHFEVLSRMEAIGNRQTQVLEQIAELSARNGGSSND